MTVQTLSEMLEPLNLAAVQRGLLRTRRVCEYARNKYDLLDALATRREMLERTDGLPGEKQALDHAIARVFSRT